MSEKAIKSLCVDQVKVGEQLPVLSKDVTATTVVLGALASRDWRPMHHDKDFAVNRNGVKDIFINTPNNAAWFERYITDWTGPKGRLGRMKFKMNSSVFPGDKMVMSGSVENITTDDSGCCWLEMNVAVSVDGKVSTSCQARVAIPKDENDNPWRRKGDQWKP
jgi:acyl dehydratase